MTTANNNSPILGIKARMASGVVGVLLLVSAGVVAYFPPTKSTIELNAFDVQTRRTGETIEVTYIFATVFLAGISLLLYAVNGYKFNRFSAAGVSAESAEIAKEAERQLNATAEGAEKIEIDKSQDPVPEPTNAPASVVHADDETYSVYPLTEVPLKVLQDAINSWPVEQRKPRSLAEFDFASRKKGKGNHAWQVKFRDIPTVIVTYGGYGKDEATVKPKGMQ